MHWINNLEGVIMLGFGALCATAFAGSPAAPAETAQPGAHSGPAPAMVVVVTGKRLSAAEKRAFDLQARS